MKTKFTWKLVDANEMSSGTCFEVDSKTSGQKYISATDKEKCKPENTVYIFIAKVGQCFEVDEQTSGKQYFNKVNRELCKPKKTINLFKKINNNDGCYEIDIETKGLRYFDRIDSEKCQGQDKELVFYFLPDNQGEGKCYIKNDLEEYIKVEHVKCRPSETKFIFERTDPLKGKCFERAKDDKNKYSKKVSMDNCRIVKTEFVFLRDKNPKDSKCYEIDSETKGNKFISIAKDEKCRQ